MSKFDENLKREQERTKEALRRRLEERKRKRKHSEMGKPEAIAVGGESPYQQTGTAQKLEALQRESAPILSRGPGGPGPTVLSSSLRDEGEVIAHENFHPQNTSSP